MQGRYQVKYWFLLRLACLPFSLHAGEIEPRAYVNTPVGVNFMLAGYVYSDGGLSTAAASPIKDAELKMDSEVLAYARSLNVMGKSAKFDKIVPYSDLSGSAMVSGQPRERNVEGLNDPRFRFSMNFYGAPAVSLAEFAGYQQDPLYTTQLHLTYNFARGAWVALSGTTDNGGRTRVNGVWSDDLQENSRIGATLAVSLDKIVCQQRDTHSRRV